MRILVTGGTGFIGSHVVERLLQARHTLRVMAHSAARLPELRFIDEQTELVLGDLSDRSTLRRALDGMEAIVHLAWSTVPKNATADPAFDVQSNVIGTIHLLEQAREQQLKHFVFISSGGTVYGRPQTDPIPETHPTRPISAYGLSKLTIEKYLHLYYELYGLDYTVLRVANAFGERQNLLKGQGVIGVWLQRIRQGKPIEIWGDGQVVRDYVYVKDVAEAVAQVLASRSSYAQTFNVGSGHGYSLRQVAASLQRVMQAEPDIRYLPGRDFDVPSNVLDINRIRQSVGWQPQTRFETGIERVREWLATNF